MDDINISSAVKFSVLIPVYNGDSYDLFVSAIESIKSNTKLPDQIVVVRDGPVSNDIEKYLKALSKSEKFEIIRIKDNVGIAKALNYGLTYVRNEWVFRADADDINEPERFSNCLPFLTGNLAVLGGIIQEVDDDGEFSGLRVPPVSDVEIRKYIKYRNPFNHMSVVYRKSVVESVGGYPDLHLKEDYGLWIKIVSAGYPVRNIDKILVTANAGSSLLKRRTGLRYLRSEINLHNLLVAEKLQNRFNGIFILILRIAALLAPVEIKKWIYRIFLRKR